MESDSGDKPANRDRSGFRIALLVREINALVNATITEELASSGLTLPQITAMRLLSHSGGQTMSELGREMNASPSTIAGIVDRLEAAGVVERRRDQADRRVVHVAFTEMGSTKAVKARSVVDGCFAKAFCAIGDSELSRIEAGLETIVHTLRGPGCADASPKE